jgi:predicted phage terminase large subunit-like protein
MLEMRAARDVHIPGYGAVLFRRSYPQIMQKGGLWDTARRVFPARQGRPVQSRMEYEFPSKATIQFRHLQNDKDLEDWDGAQIPLIGIDQAEHWPENQFFYLLARARTDCGVRPRLYATCNPNPRSFLRTFLDWWIDPKTGIAIPERSGVVRWFQRVEDKAIWGDSREEVIAKCGEWADPKSFTFIPATVYDNPILLKANPEYLSNLKALDRISRERLLGGNWNVVYGPGSYFDRTWFEIEQSPPAMRWVLRYWDRAATYVQPGAAPPPGVSATAGVKMGVDFNGVFWVLDVEHFYERPGGVEKRILQCCLEDGVECECVFEGDPGQAGIKDVEDLIKSVKALPGFFKAKGAFVRENKGIRATKFSRAAERGNVKLVLGRWNGAYLDELEGFDGSNDYPNDQVDGSSGAYNSLTTKKLMGVLGAR